MNREMLADTIAFLNNHITWLQVKYDEVEMDTDSEPSLPIAIIDAIADCVETIGSALLISSDDPLPEEDE